jgi:myo-inositol-1(or 4)-monophosphatase
MRMARMNSPYMTIMIRAAEKAARSLRRDFGEVENLQVSRKGPGDFVSAADKRAEEIIFENLKRDKPEFNFLMEEGGAVEGTNPDFRWIIDPLDGTTNFLHGIPHFAISIALEHKEDIIAGLIYDPIKDEMFTAEKNKGAFMRRKRLRVSGRNDLVISTIATGAPRRTKNDRERFIKEYDAVLAVSPGLRRFGAAALDLAYVAAGRFEGFWERKLQPWDIAAGALIVKESGGLISDLDNDKNDPIKTGNILAANTHIFNDLKNVIKTV